jgi:hypothetical protein
MHVSTPCVAGHPLVANSGAHLTPAWLRTGPEKGVVGTDKPMILIGARSSSPR